MGLTCSSWCCQATESNDEADLLTPAANQGCGESVPEVRIDFNQISNSRGAERRKTPPKEILRVDMGGSGEETGSIHKIMSLNTPTEDSKLMPVEESKIVSIIEEKKLTPQEQGAVYCDCQGDVYHSADEDPSSGHGSCVNLSQESITSEDLSGCEF